VAMRPVETLIRMAESKSPRPSKSLVTTRILNPPGYPCSKKGESSRLSPFFCAFLVREIKQGVSFGQVWGGQSMPRPLGPFAMLGNVFPHALGLHQPGIEKTVYAVSSPSAGESLANSGLGASGPSMISIPGSRKACCISVSGIRHFKRIMSWSSIF